jgi:uncharacterized protein (DUF433 family)
VSTEEVNMPVTFGVQVVPLASDDTGTVRVSGTRVTLDTLVGLYEQGLTAEEIQIELPVLDLPDIYAALAYYLTHRETVRAYLNDRREQTDRFRADVSVSSEQSLIRERLMARLHYDER